jgi:fatty acid-binding protein DegV
MMRSAQCREYNQKLNKVLIGLLETMSLHPIITLKNSNFSLAGLCFGNKYRRAVRYIDRQLRNKDKISGEVLFIVLAGCEYDVRKRIEEEARKQMPWKHVYVLRASATISCNSGAGTFGMAYFNK